MLKALQQFSRTEQLSKSNEYKCDGCKHKVRAEKQMSLHELPNVLTIQLKRFNFMKSVASLLLACLGHAISLLDDFNGVASHFGLHPASAAPTCCHGCLLTVLGVVPRDKKWATSSSTTSS